MLQQTKVGGDGGGGDDHGISFLALLLLNPLAILSLPGVVWSTRNACHSQLTI